MSIDQMMGDDSWLEEGLGGSGRLGGLTEAQLSDELGPDFLRDLPIPRNVSATIAWWQRRQGAFNRVVEVWNFSCLTCWVKRPPWRPPPALHVVTHLRMDDSIKSSFMDLPA